MSKLKKSNLELLRSFPAWQVIREDLQTQANTLHQELTEIDYERDNKKKFTLDDIKRAELSILNMLINLPDTLIEDLKDLLILEYEEEEKEQE